MKAGQKCTAIRRILAAPSAVAQVRAHDPHVVFLCSPNNPTGGALPLAVIDRPNSARLLLALARAELLLQHG